MGSVPARVLSGNRGRMSVYEGARAPSTEEPDIGLRREFDEIERTVVASVASGDVERRQGRWSASYVRYLVWSDTVIVAVAILGSYFLRFPHGEQDVAVSGGFRASYFVISLGLLLVWCLSLALRRTRHPRLLGTGPQEYAAVFSASWLAFSTVAIATLILKIDIARGFLLMAFPVGVLLLLINRRAARRRLRRARLAGRRTDNVVVAGSLERCGEMITEITLSPEAGLRVVGLCVPETELGESTEVLGVPVLGSVADTAEAARRTGATLVVLTGSSVSTVHMVKKLAWKLEGTGIELALAPSLYDIAGPRIIRSKVSGTDLLHVDEARFEGPKYLFKTSIEWIGALALTLVLCPLLLTAAILVATTSRGPVFFRQERVGKDGTTFRMWKFRSMYVDAEARLAELVEHNEGSGPLFKMKDDPRVTPIGRILRRYSIDEVPQLFNVLTGDMSLVGPRPPLRREVAHYEAEVHRRFLVKPGITGLWQVSGRSDLTWEQSVRVDLNYVENWSPLGDLLILIRTLKAVITPEGAY